MWVQKDEKWGKSGNFGAYHTQEAGFPRKLALWIGKGGFSYMQHSPLDHVLYLKPQLPEPIINLKLNMCYLL